ncbi:SPX domain-containing membrane protein [Capsicum baccatum]|uniref:SPX domain-containing membrane protein n=1 Tax=Capsicum baccatum TaxID=33114 RepID=A0A2G2VB52_CAPBA|nr:SPX domain-containing membrane protein [Capsicum baccatum]
MIEELNRESSSGSYYGAGASWEIDENDAFEKGVVQPLLLKSVGDEQDIEGDQECDGSEEVPEESCRPGNSIVEAYRLLTPSVKVCGVPFCFQGEIEQGAKEGKGLQRGHETFRLSWHPILQPKG